MKLTFNAFKGMAPRYDPTQLPTGHAEKAVDVRLRFGGVRPLKDFVLEPSITPLPGAQSLYYYSYFDMWLLSTDIREYANTVIPNDIYKRLFYTDANYPKVRSNTDEYRLGIQPPVILSIAANPVATDYGAGPGHGDLSDPLLVENPAYVATYVDAWGFEGPPSLPFNVPFPVGPGFSLLVGCDVWPVDPALNLGTGSKLRFYRTAVSATDTEYLFVADIDYPNNLLTDSIDTGDLQEPLPSATWIGPPNDDIITWPDGPLRGIADAGNGFLVGFSGNTLHFSEPYLPHAWPLDYRLPGPDKIIGVVVVSKGVLVLTTGRPWLATGNSPSSMLRIPIDTNQSCVSGRSIVDMGTFATWASPDGICASDGGEPTLLTKNIFDNETFKPYNPEDIISAYFEGEYIFATSGAVDGGILTTAEESGITFVEFSSPLKIVAFHYTLQDDELFCLMSDGSVHLFDQGAPKTTARWKSAIFRFPFVAFNCMKSDANSFPVKVDVICSDEMERFRLDVAFSFASAIHNSAVYRLPAGLRARYWQFDMHPIDHLHTLEVSDNVAELT